MTDLTITWMKCGDNRHWCDFLNLNLANEHFENLKGVYVIWNDEVKTVRVGSGIIKDRIAAHRKDDEITSFRNLKVTWAQVNTKQMEGIEKYLADELEPEIGERFPDRMPISVNLPEWV